MLMKEGVGPSAIARISKALTALMPDHFSAREFERAAMAGLDDLELKQRISHVIAILGKFLPESFKESSAILMALPDVWDRGDPDDPIAGFAIWPLTDYVAEFGMAEPKISLEVLYRLTPLFSAEFAIRYFIIEHPKLTLRHFKRWISDPDEHVRRLVSEGLRPRLPWGIQLKKYIVDPEEVLPFLNALRLDESDYVRRSVANNLNDISKDHPDRVVALCESWQAKDGGKSDWVIRHATRTLVKQGHPRTFPLLGYTKRPAAVVEGFVVDKAVKLGHSLNFEFRVISRRKTRQKIVVDFSVHYMKSNGQHSSKVFKLKNIELAAEGDEVCFEKDISFKKITTRKYYPGEHQLAIHINGKEYAKKPFLLVL